MALKISGQRFWDKHFRVSKIKLDPFPTTSEQKHLNKRKKNKDLDLWGENTEWYHYDLGIGNYVFKKAQSISVKRHKENTAKLTTLGF